MRVEREIVLPASQDDVWRAVTEPDRLASCSAATSRWTHAPAAAWSSPTRTVNGGARSRCFEPGQRLVVRLWKRSDALRGTRLEFALDDVDDGTRLTVVESQLTSGGDGLRGPKVMDGRPMTMVQRG